MQCPVAPAFSLSAHRESLMGKLCLRGDPRICGQLAQCVFQARGLIAAGQRLAPPNEGPYQF